MTHEKNYGGHFYSSIAYAFVASLFVYFIYKEKGPYAYYEISSFDFTIMILAVYRLTRLFVYDLIMDFTRDYFAQSKRHIAITISEILGCPWCTGVWIALVVAFFYFLTPIAWYFIFFVALAGAGSILQAAANLMMKIPSPRE